MRPTISVVRAVGAEFARRLLRPIIIFGTLIVLVLLGAGGWLITQNSWWWLLEIVFIMGGVVFLSVILMVRAIIRGVEPALNVAQKRATQAFVDKLERVAENLQTPQIIVVYYVLRDVVRPRASGFVETVSQDSRALAPDFMRLRKEF